MKSLIDEGDQTLCFGGFLLALLIQHMKTHGAETTRFRVNQKQTTMKNKIKCKAKTKSAVFTLNRLSACSCCRRRALLCLMTWCISDLTCLWLLCVGFTVFILFFVDDCFRVCLFPIRGNKITDLNSDISTQRSLTVMLEFLM